MAKTTITQAKAAYARAIPAMRTNYVAGITAFFEGANVSNSAPVGNYLAKVTPGAENKWVDGLKARYGLK
jgi:pyrroline-5-carboxylate reductase